MIWEKAIIAEENARRRKRDCGILVIGFSLGFAIAAFFAGNLIGSHKIFLVVFPISFMILGIAYIRSSRSVSDRAL